MMQEGIKCPNCGGNRFNELGNNAYKCLYCGSTFTHKETESVESSSIEKSDSDTNLATPPTPIVNTNSNKQHYVRPPYMYRGKSKTTALVLCFFLGAFGGHKFYLGQTGWGLAYLVFCWTWIPCIISVIEFIILLCMSEDEFDYKYNY
mgnify:CR=1 FL=1|jgi:TM2 domain-containing membrane protein YozV/DNA-directed RNA polymerase subunit RPC12/RpoP